MIKVDNQTDHDGRYKMIINRSGVLIYIIHTSLEC